MINHTFSICAYKESPFLEECIISLLKQKIKSKVIVCTSTPNDYIISLAKKYKLSLHIRNKANKENSIAEDWNFALSKAETEYCTLAHQDDIYLRNYTEFVLKEINNSSKPIIIFSDYAELREKVKTFKGFNLKIKRFLQKPLKYKLFRKSKFLRRILLSFGTPICCPSICFSKKNIIEPVFSSKLKCSLDWLAWSNLSYNEGDFVYINRVLMLHRIHKNSETTNLINKTIRQDEDYYMFCKFWPIFFAKVLSKFYSLSLRYNFS